jgi:saccharopine dehydrogenase-like NADP-dependent oxidoreductase
MKKICVIGAGKIGRTINAYLKLQGHEVFLVDSNPNIKNAIHIDANDEQAVSEFIKDKDIVVSSAPYNVNITIADSCAAHDVAYFDLTEDVEVCQHIKNLKTDTFMMPQCGLAPGAVNIIAADLIKQFSRVDKVKMRVGALPMYTANSMAYYLTWSTSGLINEYVNEVDVISGGKHIKAQPLDGLETIYIDGNRYEAFNTSGGVATMCETFKDKVHNMSYKTIRYPGHHDSMKFLLEDLNLKHNKEKFIDLFDQEVPYTTKDVVVMFITVIGQKDGILQELTYHKKIYGDKALNGIQKTTASGVCAVVEAYAEGKLSGKGFQCQEDVPFEVFTSNKFGKLYEQE